MPKTTRPQRGPIEVIAILAIVAGALVAGFALLRNSDGSNDQSTLTVTPDTGAGLNISCYVYRDVNRDGTFDVDDHPYAGLVVTGSGGNGSSSAPSNTAGFANFQMLLGDDASFVNQPGTYTFDAVVPDGWSITSESAAREVEFVELSGSPVGIVATSQCEPFGVAPVLSLSGPLPQQGATVEIDSATGSVEPELVDGTSFRAEVEAGDWTVTFADDAATSRSVAVSSYPVSLSAEADEAGDFDPLPTTVSADFDDLISANTLTEVPSGYRGLEWSNWVAAHRILYGGPGYVNGVTSGEFAAYNGSGHPATVSSDDPFDFVGAHVSVAWPPAEQHDIVIRAWRADELVYTDRLRASTSGPVFFDADYRSITKLEIGSAANWQIVIDDPVFRVGS